MGTLIKENPNTRELVTEILDETRWWNALRLVVEFLGSKGVDNVRVGFGFVLDLDIALCNDADLHFASAEPSLIEGVVSTLCAGGIKVYDSGRLV